MLDTPLSEKLLKTTSVYIAKLHKLGIHTVSDLLGYLPRAYENRSQYRLIHEIDLRENNVVKARVNAVDQMTVGNRKKLIQAELEDAQGNVMQAVWFNQPHILRILVPQKEYVFSGRVKHDFGRMQMQSPLFEEVKSEQIHTGRIVPIYPEFETTQRNSIGSDWLRNKIYLILSYARYETEFLPPEIVAAERLIPRSQALANIHFPASEEVLRQAQIRLAFDELFLLEMAALMRKKQYQEQAASRAHAIPLQVGVVKQFLDTLPFTLTDSQRIVTYQILKDTEKVFPMIRLLEGDVGSGKTIVATIAAFHTIKAGYQVAFMVPTEVLARQHFEKIAAQLAPFDVSVELLTGSTPKKEKDRLKSAISAGTCSLVIGTHALLEESVAFSSLGLAIIDEQHRFGVTQRKQLALHGYPHVLHMTATPIPRTLALTIYGDQDLSILHEMPLGRLPIVTRVVSPDKREQAYRFVSSELTKGHQVYVICPLIEESQTLEFKTVTAEVERLRTVFPDSVIQMLHGKMKGIEKQQIMEEFANNKIQMLVSTTVIEVGIDVKNATVIMIEGADHFGLAQLHQLRGRVGRDMRQSYCFLFASEKATDTSVKRLRYMEKTNNGFELAEYDLHLRGAGELYGVRQSGLPDLKAASLLDAKLIEKTRNHAEHILNQDASLNSFPQLKQRLVTLPEFVVS